MQEGRKREINWEDWTAPKLYINPTKVDTLNYISCGSTALSLLTQLPLKQVESYNPNPKRGWSTTRAIRFLRNKGYKTLEVTKMSVTNTYWFKTPLKPDHCLLLNVRLDVKENSMMVCHKNVLWHNFETIDELSNLYFLNKPTQDVIIITHPKWRHHAN